MNLQLEDAHVDFYPDFFSGKESNEFLLTLMKKIQWKGECIQMFGKTIPVPRLVAWYGDDCASYTYSNIQHKPHSWQKCRCLLGIKKRVEAAAKTAFNGVLLNWYRNGQDSMSWHSDDEPELGNHPVIGSVSFGATRRFQFKHKKNPNLRQSIDLTNGSLLIMSGATQHHWLHQVPKTKKNMTDRINLTFRFIYPNKKK
ncbi:MAG: alpha-ketoglutarate-dependent dioxygenase AlkB [Verrucomicrobiota bacterium]